MTGFLAEVGRGKWAPGKAKDLFEKGDPKELAPFTAPPSGLFLEKVLYPQDSWEQPIRPVLFLPR